MRKCSAETCRNITRAKANDSLLVILSRLNEEEERKMHKK